MGSHAHYNKQRPFDESIRVPFLVYDGRKAGIQPGNYDAMIGADDIMPTLLGLAVVDIPETVEGVDFAQYLRGEEASPTEDRKSVGEGTSVSVRVDLGGLRSFKKKNRNPTTLTVQKQTPEEDQ